MKTTPQVPALPGMSPLGFKGGRRTTYYILSVRFTNGNVRPIGGLHPLSHVRAILRTTLTFWGVSRNDVSFVTGYQRWDPSEATALIALPQGSRNWIVRAAPDV